MILREEIMNILIEETGTGNANVVGKLVFESGSAFVQRNCEANCGNDNVSLIVPDPFGNVYIVVSICHCIFTQTH